MEGALSKTGGKIRPYAVVFVEVGSNSPSGSQDNARLQHEEHSQLLNLCSQVYAVHVLHMQVDASYRYTTVIK
jgi:hypothetical protein